MRLVVDDSLNLVSEHALDIAVGAVNAWQGASRELPTLVVEQGRKAKLGYDPAIRNQNSIVFAPKGAPQANGALAITIVTYDRSEGKILDADIVFNGEHRFAPAEILGAGAQDAYDLQNVLTHELGHFLGLGEQPDDKRSTMFPHSAPQETSKRGLTERDRRILRGLYRGNAPGPSECGLLPSRAHSIATVFPLLLVWLRRGHRRSQGALGKFQVGARVGGALLLLGLCGLSLPSDEGGALNKVVSQDPWLTTVTWVQLQGDVLQVVYALYPSP